MQDYRPGSMESVPSPLSVGYGCTRQIQLGHGTLANLDQVNQHDVFLSIPDGNSQGHGTSRYWLKCSLYVKVPRQSSEMLRETDVQMISSQELGLQTPSLCDE